MKQISNKIKIIVLSISLLSLIVSSLSVKNKASSNNLVKPLDSHYRKMTSFLKLRETEEFTPIDNNLEKALDDLENDDLLHTTKEDEYKSLNNDAFVQRKELEHELAVSNGETHNMDMILD